MPFRLLNKTTVETDSAEEMCDLLNITGKSLGLVDRPRGSRARGPKRRRRKTDAGWGAAQEEAKKQGREDVARVRIEIAAAKKKAAKKPRAKPR